MIIKTGRIDLRPLGSRTRFSHAPRSALIGLRRVVLKRLRLSYFLFLTLLAVFGCGPDQTKALLQAPQALGVILAEETARAAGTNHTVGVITPDSSWGPVSAAETSFREAMGKMGYSVTTAKAANLGNPISFGAGLDGAEFLEALEEARGAGAVVCFGGAPLLSPSEADRVSAGHPPVLVVATMALGSVPGIASDRLVLTNLLASKIIQAAFIDGADASASMPANSDATHDLFARSYRIVRPVK